MKDLLIIGASGFGREVAWLVERINKAEPTWNLLGFLDDNAQLHGTQVGKYPVLGGCEAIQDYPQAYLVCAVGSSKIREKIIQKAENILSAPLYATLIDPTVEMSDTVVVGEGSILCAHTILTVDLSLGKHTIINLDCTVGHDAILEDYVTLYPSVNVSGCTHIGRGAELGTGMQIIQGKRIGEYAIVGAGAVVVKDIPAKCTAIGSPAKPIKFFE